MTGRRLRSARGVARVLLAAAMAGSAGTSRAGRPVPRPVSGYLEYSLVVRQPTGGPASTGGRAAARPREAQLQRSRHRIWFKGPMVRIDMTSQPPGAPLARAAHVTVDYIRSGGKPGTMLVPDGYSLIHNVEGTFVFRRGAAAASELTKRKQPFLNRRNGALPSLPIIDRALLSHWKPGRVGSEFVGRYHTEIYQRNDFGSRAGTRRGYVRVWVSDHLPVPVKFRSQYGDIEREELLKAVRFPAAVPDSVFRLPPGTKLIESHADDED